MEHLSSEVVCPKFISDDSESNEKEEGNYPETNSVSEHVESNIPVSENSLEEVESVLNVENFKKIGSILDGARILMTPERDTELISKVGLFPGLSNLPPTNANQNQSPENLEQKTSSKIDSNLVSSIKVLDLQTFKSESQSHQDPQTSHDSELFSASNIRELLMNQETQSLAFFNGDVGSPHLSSSQVQLMAENNIVHSQAELSTGISSLSNNTGVENSMVTENIELSPVSSSGLHSPSSAGLEYSGSKKHLSPSSPDESPDRGDSSLNIVSTTNSFSLHPTFAQRTTETQPGVIQHENLLKPPEISTDVSSVPSPIEFPVVPAPCMRGQLQIDQDHHICKGFWGMTRAAHEVGDISPFEYRSNVPAGSQVFPYCGFYRGFFMVRQPHPRHPIKVEETSLFLKFIENTEGTFNLEGNGTNKYGAYTMSGILKPDGYIEFYRCYQTIKSPSKGNKKLVQQSKKKSKTLEKKSSPDGLSTSDKPAPALSHAAFSSRAETHTTFSNSPAPVPPELPQRTPRSSRGSWKDIANSESTENNNGKGLKRKLTSAAPMNDQTPKGRVGRPKQTSIVSDIDYGQVDIKFTKDVQRQIMDLMLFMTSRKNSFWFNQPVDPEALNIPDYFDIIKNPMDFGTVKSRLDSGFYSRLEDFAAEVRLTLKNAVTYNVQKDNPVNIAAKELSKLFEERYKKLYDKIAGEFAKQKPGRSKSVGKQKGSGVGPRGIPSENVSGDMVSSSYLAKMQEQMMQMQQTIIALQRGQNTDSNVPQQMMNSFEPTGAMSFHEKRALSENINRLPPDKLTRVVQIIQESVPLGERTEEEEIEIDIDSLDPPTLRKLEIYVKESLRSKKISKRGRPSHDSLADRNLNDGSGYYYEDQGY